jgi:hypothetical protein
LNGFFISNVFLTVPCFGKGVVEPEDKTPFKYVNRYGETDLHFTSYKLNDIREKRGIRPLDRKPRYDYSGEDSETKLLILYLPTSEIMKPFKSL